MIKSSKTPVVSTFQGVEFAEKPSKNLSAGWKSHVQSWPKVKYFWLAFNGILKRFCVSGQSKSTSVEPALFFQLRWEDAQLRNDKTHNQKHSWTNCYKTDWNSKSEFGGRMLAHWRADLYPKHFLSWQSGHSIGSVWRE